MSSNPYPTSPAYPAAPQYPVAGYGAPPPQGNSNTLGLIGMILGIVGIPLSLCCWPLGLALAIPAGVLGFLGMKKVQQGQATNRGMALAAVICAGVCVVVAILALVLGFASALTRH